MAFDKTPTAWIEGWSEDGTNVSFPLASFPELTAAEADGASGDIRKILFAMLMKFADVNGALDVADRSTRMTIARTVNANFQDQSILDYTFNINFQSSVLAIDVADE